MATQDTLSHPDTNIPARDEWRETCAYTLGVQAQVFGFPYINLSTIRWKWVTQAPPGPAQDYIQHESPGKDKELNWLPSPPSGIFTLKFRAYWPDKEVAEGKWYPPGVMPV